MILNTFIATIILVTIVMLALGIKLLFDKDAEFTMHSCKFDNAEDTDQEEACSFCGLKDLTNCPEKTNIQKLL
jgi:hypothetical protein